MTHRTGEQQSAAKTLAKILFSAVLLVIGWGVAYVEVKLSIAHLGNTGTRHPNAPMFVTLQIIGVLSIWWWTLPYLLAAPIYPWMKV